MADTLGMKKLFFITLFTYAQISWAEYRVFVLKISNKTKNRTKIINSTLDPEQYKSFYLLNPDEVISYVNTWRCKGSTRDFTALCAGPLPKVTPQNSQNVQNKS